MTILTGYDAISYAQERCLLLNCDAGVLQEELYGLAPDAAAEIACEHPELIWVEVDED